MPTPAETSSAGPGYRWMLALGATNAAIAVAAGAFGAHALSGSLDERLREIWATGVEYHMYHALGLIAVALLLQRRPGARAVLWAGWLFLGGMLLFSGSLYALSLTGERWLGAVTPFGGTALLCGWVSLAWGALRSELPAQ